jgi:hypothetical protein
MNTGFTAGTQISGTHDKRQRPEMAAIEGCAVPLPFRDARRGGLWVANSGLQGHIETLKLLASYEIGDRRCES